MFVNFKVFYFSVVIFVLPRSHVKAKYLIHKAEYVDQGTCVMRLAVEGHGVKGVLRTSCEDGRRLRIRVEDDQILIGDRNDPISAFSEKFGYLVILEQYGKVQRRTRNLDFYRNYQEAVGEKPIPSDLGFMNRILGIISPKTTDAPIVDNPLYSDVLVIKYEKLSDFKNSCIGTIHVRGIQILYDQRMTCHQVQDMRVFFSPEGVILHDYRGAIQSVILSQESVVTVTHDGSCKQMTSTNKDSEKETVVIIDIPSCNRVKAFVDQYLGVRAYWYAHNDVYDVLVRGRSLDYTFKGLTESQAYSTYIKYSARLGVLLVGEYMMNALSAFCDTPGSLVVLHDYGKNCTSHTFEEGEHTSAEIMDEEDCLKTKERINNAWKTIKRYDLDSFYEFWIRRFKLDSNVKNTVRPKRNVQRLIVEAGGIGHDFYDLKSTLDRLELRPTINGLVLCDYKKLELCLVAEQNYSVVYKNNVCTKMTKDKVITKWTADKVTCDAELEKAKYYRNRKV